MIFRTVATYALKHGFMSYQTVTYVAVRRKAGAATLASAKAATRHTKLVMRNVHPSIIDAVHRFVRVAVALADVSATVTIRILVASPTGKFV